MGLLCEITKITGVTFSITTKVYKGWRIAIGKGRLSADLYYLEYNLRPDMFSNIIGMSSPTKKGFFYL